MTTREIQRKRLSFQLNMNLARHLTEDTVTHWFTYLTATTPLSVPAPHVRWTMDVRMPQYNLLIGVLICMKTGQMTRVTIKLISPIILPQTKLKQVVNLGMLRQHTIII